MRSLVGRPVFSAGERTYFWEDVAAAAWRWGDWGTLEDQTRAAIACQRRLDERPQALARADVEAAANAFRYDRRLLSADETTAWLDRSGLTVDEWMEYVRGSVLREQWAAEVREVVAANPVAADEIEQRIWVQGFCSGRLERWAHELAGRAAVYDRIESEQHVDRAEPVEVPRLPPLGLAPETWRQASHKTAPLEDAFHRFVSRAAAPAEVARQIDAHRLEWLCVEYESLVLPSEEVAREAVLALLDDGRPLTEVASDADTRIDRARSYLDEAPAHLAQPFLSASENDVVGPLADDDGGYHVVRVLTKVAPSMHDAAILERAERALQRDRLRREVESRIRWHEHF